MAKLANATPVARPTEWTSAVALLGGALLMFSVDKNAAALVAVVGACLPAITTAIVSAVRKRREPAA
jgi:hypothetical protein